VTDAEKDGSSLPAIAVRRLRGGRRGFTLLEVMVAVMILGLVLVSLLGLKNRGMEDVMVAEKMTSATLLAKRLMTQVLTQATTQPLQPMEEEGEFPEEEFKAFTWRKVIAPTPLPTVLEVRVAVLWKEGTRQEQVELVSYE
jgi:prepilin-type N-terminal cleavage/methylation domain-containing protein